MSKETKKQHVKKYGIITIIVCSAIITGILIIPKFIDSVQVNSAIWDDTYLESPGLLDGTKIAVIPVEPTTAIKTSARLLFSLYGNEGENYVIENENPVFTNPVIKLRTDLPDFYQNTMAINADQTTLVIYPIFTANAYKKGGFYDYYRGDCDESCLKVDLDDAHFSGKSSGIAFHIFQELGYDWTTDTHIALKPEILKNYDRIILLHSEYVTKEMYDAIRSHQKVIYLYPNALYAEVEFDGSAGWIKLIKGHGYQNIDNGFSFEFDNTDLEYDTACKEPFFYEIDNGWMLSCYPEEALLYNKDLLQKVRDI